LPECPIFVVFHGYELSYQLMLLAQNCPIIAHLAKITQNAKQARALKSASDLRICGRGGRI
jgi:Na+/melibiose symporter-like transporter